MMALTETAAPAHTATPWIGPGGQRMSRLELHLTYTCPERCVFCSEDHRMKRFARFPVTWGRIVRVLRTHGDRGVRNVHLTGGEPTIHPRFIDTLKLAKGLGMRTSVGTIGTRLSDPSFAKATMPFLDEALFSLHGPNASVHDALTGRKGSFDRVCAAIQLSLENRPGFGAFVNTVITKHNIEQLPDTVALAAKLGAQLIVISNTTPEGAGADKYNELAISLTDLARVLPTVPARAGEAIVRFFGVPMCLLGEHHMLSNDLHWDPRVTVEWAATPNSAIFTGIYSWTPTRKRVHVEECQGCTRAEVCSGVFDQYAQTWPTETLQAFGPNPRESA
jgi:MoaA/NifB/PqqE/SkfB family radical SAM enzyme